jgi:hypothetical protein
MYGNYSTKAQADQAVQEVKKWAATINDPDWKITGIEVSSLGGSANSTATSNSATVGFNENAKPRDPQVELSKFPLRPNFATNSRGSTEGLHPKMQAVIPRAEAIYRAKTGDRRFKLVINAGQEWHNGHVLSSRHHAGYAVDFQTRLLPGGGDGPLAHAIVQALQRDLGSEYSVQLHTPDNKNPNIKPHIHVELISGVKAWNPGDYPDPNKS